MKNSWYTYFNYGTIIFVAILLILVILNVIPRNLYIYILVLTIIIFVLRIAARVFYTMKSKSENRES